MWLGLILTDAVGGLNIVDQNHIIRKYIKFFVKVKVCGFDLSTVKATYKVV